ncbi:hypothetical protein [Longimicrobium sp.]|uniref:hypothetical protein n=1 Tax=Longimicrobium sp. TaxID=2029185 RepID=UPI002E361388|nr:hypothetical protein [Longimicrobium sp.]HEX6037858.1 hypothetical protein [Longimicrobium sp.]
MKKIALNVESLAIESFETGSGMGQARGTVAANQQTLNANCYTRVGSCYRTACCPDTTLC